MAIIEKSVPLRNSGRNAKRNSGSITREAELSSIFIGMGRSYNLDRTIRITLKASANSKCVFNFTRSPTIR